MRLKNQWRSRAPASTVLAIALCGLAAIATLAACGGGINNYGSVSFADAQHGWVTGWDGANKKTVISATGNAGVTWALAGSQGVPQNTRIVGPAAFSTSTTGVWCVGLDKVLYTTTGGEPWQTATVAGMKNSYFSAMSFASADVGWASVAIGRSVEGASGGSVAKTSDGGATWVVQKKVRRAGGFADVACPTEPVCYALKHGAWGGVWATSDGGARWTRHRLPGAARRPVYDAIAFPTELTGWAVGTFGKIAKTTDGGVTWVKQVSGVRAWLHDVCFTSVDRGFAVGKGGIILSTQDGGTTWVRQDSGCTANLHAVDFVSSDEGWVVGKAGWTPDGAGTFLHSTDAGQTWK